MRDEGERTKTVETGGEDDRHVYRVDVGRLNRAGTSRKGAVDFDDASVKDMVVWIEVWDHERREVAPIEKKRYLAAKAVSKDAAALGYEFRPAELDWAENDFPLRRWDRYRLGILASNIEKVWRRRGGKGSAGWGDKRLGTDTEWGGPVTELMLELMTQIGIPAEDQPNRSTIQKAMTAFGRAMRDDNKKAPA